MSAYGEFREPFPNMEDNRFVFYGMRHYIENFVNRKWCKADVDAAEIFYKTHKAGFTPYPFPKDLFYKFINENDGYLPVTIEALPEGTVAYIHTPCFIITAEEEYSRLCTYLETILTMIWYPTCVATLSRYTRDLIERSFKKSVDDELMWLLDSRLHDFGFRGCTSVEQAVLGGSAHLLNFEGSDTMSACYHVQFHLNGGKPVGTSIPATEHSVMTAWESEEAAMLNEIEHFGDGLFACVMDSYDYDNALNVVLPKVAEAKVAKGGTIVLRPDSGDPVEAVMKGLYAAEKTFGCTTNSKGFKVINSAAVIQGDGINYQNVQKILDAVLEAKFSAMNVAFGMGGALLQKVNRDTMSFATKLSHLVYANGEERDVMKTPKTSSAKTSLPGRLFVCRESPGAPPMVYPLGDPACKGMEPVLKVVYNKRPIPGVFDDFETVRERVRREWAAIPPNGKPIAPQLQTKINNILRSRGHKV
uniref:Nicotinamide phosphoribosyltransferase n=1 Tax=Guillardia theta TaxID=55529 RepID=A0A7S4KY47_GUITH